MGSNSAQRRLAMTLATAGLTGVVIAGCGGGASRGGAPALVGNGDREMVQFVRCMRSHGVDMPDPFHRPGHEGLSIDLPQQSPASVAAQRACGSVLQPLIETKLAHLRALAEPELLGLVHYAQCMREHGIPMLDPDSVGQLNLGNVPGINTGFGRYSPQFRSADQSCRHLLPATVHDNGSGP